MKGKLKLIILLMLALFLVACGSASPGGGTGGGIIPKPFVLEGWKNINDDIVSEVKKAQGDLEYSDEDDSVVYQKSPLCIAILNKSKVLYNEEVVKSEFPSGTKMVALDLAPGKSHLEFKSDVNDMEFQDVANNGNIYFVDNPKETRVYSIKISGTEVNKLFWNFGNIYVMDGNHGSTLKIDGNYSSNNGNIHLGLYVSEDRTKFSTDKVHITGKTEGQTKVNFVYNKEQVKGLVKNAKYYEDDKDNFVIKVDGDVPKGQNAFEMTPFPEGLNVFDLKYYKKEGATGSHLWKLEKK